MSNPFLEKFDYSTTAWDKSVLAVQKTLRAVPDGQVLQLRDGVLEPLCTLAEFRQAYAYLVGTLALWAVDQYSKDSEWACNSQYAHEGYRVKFNRRDIMDALGQPGCVLMGLLAMDCWARSVHDEVFKQGNRAFLSSAFQRMGEFCFATDVNPLSSLSKHARPALTSMFTQSVAHAQKAYGTLWNEPLLNKVNTALLQSGHFICIKA